MSDAQKDAAIWMTFVLALVAVCAFAPDREAACECPPAAEEIIIEELPVLDPDPEASGSFEWTNA